MRVPAIMPDAAAQVAAQSSARWRGRTTSRLVLTDRAPFIMRTINATARRRRSSGMGMFIKAQLPEKTCRNSPTTTITDKSTRLRR